MTTTLPQIRQGKKNLGISVNKLVFQKIAAGSVWQHLRFVQYDNGDPGDLGKAVCKILMNKVTAGKYSWGYFKIDNSNLESMIL